MKTQLIIMTSTAKVSGKARKYGRYKNVAVVEAIAGQQPRMISTRDKNVVSVRWHSGPVSVGKTSQCAYQRALDRANEFIAKESVA